MRLKLGQTLASSVCTTLTPVLAPIPVRLADPSGGPVVANSSTVLPCPAVPSGSLSGLHLPLFSSKLVSTAALQDAMVTTTTLGGQRVSICTCTRTGRHLATFTRRPGLCLYTLATEPPQVAASAQVSASGEVAASCSCRLLSHQTLLWHHRLGHPSLPRLCGMHSRLLVSCLPRSLPFLPTSLALFCLPCVEGRQRATPHSSSFPLMTAPLQTLHMDVWGPARISGQGRERYFMMVVDDYTRYTTVFPLRSKGEVSTVLIPWIRTVCLQLSERFSQDLPILRLHSERGGEFSSDLLRDFCRGEGITQSFTLPESPQQNGIAERHIGLVMEVARTSMIHAAAPHFLWPLAVRYAAHQLNLWPRVSLPETSPTLRWTGKVGDASVFRVWGSRAFVRDTSAEKLSARAIPCVFLGFVPDANGWQFYHPTSRCVLSSQDLTFDESVPFYHLFSYRSAPPPPPPLFLAPGPPPGAASGGAEPGGAGSEGAGCGGAEPEGVEPGGAESEGAESWGAEPWGAASSGGPAGASLRLSLQQLPGDPLKPGAAGARGVGAGVAGFGGPGAGGAGAAGAGAVDPGARGAGGTVRPRLYFVPLLQQVLGVPSTGLPPPFLCPPPNQSHPPLQPASPLPVPSPYTEKSGGLTKRREPASCPLSPVRSACRTPRSCPPPVQGTHTMSLRPSSLPLRVPLPAPPESSLPEVLDHESDRSHAASPTIARLLASAFTDPYFESVAAMALVAELLDFAAACCLDYATALVAESVSASLPSVGGECALGTDVLEDRQEDFECLAAAVPSFAFLLLALEGDPDAPDIPTPRSYADAITGTQWSLRRPVYGLRQAPCKWHDTLTTTLAALGFAPATADPLLFLRTDTSLPPFYVLVHSLSAPPSDESLEPSGPYLELVGCLMYLMTCTRSDIAYPLSLLACHVAPGRHRKVHWDAAKRVLRYLSSCEAEIYAGAMAAQELRWLTYLVTNLGEQPHLPPVLYVDNKAMIALCQEHRLEHRMKHIALRYFLARELQQRGQLCLAYVATRANTSDVFTKALPPGDHKRFVTVLGLVPTLPHLLTA
ncbi:unnamed protein product [Closterium sp. NIES-54]